MDHPHSEPPSPFWKSSAGLTWLVAAVVGGFYLVTEHRAHLYGALPYLILLACPLMHLFMHRGHHHGRHQRGSHPEHRPGGSDDQRDQ